MIDNEDIKTEHNKNAPDQKTARVNVRMQQNERASQPIYSNFTSVQGGQGAIVLDFGFLDPQLVNTLNRMTKSGEKAPDVVDAKMSCRMVLNIEAGIQLTRQLNQLFSAKQGSAIQSGQQNETRNPDVSLDTKPENEVNSIENQRGFKFHWSS